MLSERPQPKSPGKPSRACQGPRRCATPVAAAEPAPVLDDAAMFRQAVDGVRRLGDQRPARVVPKPEVTLEIVSEDAEVLAQLSDLVSGVGTFELTETEEYTEGTRLGLDPRLVTRLRRGEFAVQAHIDLHGMIQADAKVALEGFIVELGAQGTAHGAGRPWPRSAVAGRDAGAQACRRAMALAWAHGWVRAGVCDRAARPTAARVRCTCCSARSEARPFRRPARRQAPRLSARAAPERPLHRNCSGLYTATMNSVGAVRERPSGQFQKENGAGKGPVSGSIATANDVTCSNLV